MKGKWMWATVAVAGVLAGTAFAQDGSKRARRGGGGDALADYLALSAEQREQIRTMRRQHHQDVEPLREEGRDLHEKLRTALEAKNPDPPSVGAAMIALQNHRKTMEASKNAFKSKMKAQLTPEQQAKLEAFEAAREVRRGPRGRGHGGASHMSPFGPDGPPPLGSDGRPDFGPDELPTVRN